MILLSSLVFITSCNEDDFLSQVNPNQITSDTFWKSETDFSKGLTTAYGALQFAGISGADLSHEIVQSDLAGTEYWYSGQYEFTQLGFTDATRHVQNKWNELYVGVFRANQVIENLETTEATLDDSFALEVEAQARFLRAFFYFQLVHSYGGAVVHTAVAKSPEDFNKPFATKEEVTQSVIIPDLEFAKQHLPQVWDSENDLGRATWGAATSLLGKVYLFGEEWTMAATQFKEVIDSQVYSLVPNTLDNFTDENEFNSESIFEVAYSDVLKPGAKGPTIDDNENETSGEASALAMQTGQLSFGAYNTVISSYYLHELMVYDEMDTDNPINSGYTHSQRFYSSIAPIDSDGLYYNLPTGSKGGWAYGQSAYVKKHSNWYHWDTESPLERSGINFRHIRLADVYLMYAEAVLEANSDVATAIQYIDMVRARAGVITLQSYMDNNGGTFPVLHKSVQVHGSHQMVSPSEETVMTHLRMVERPIELCFEGHRWKDLVRWGIVKETFDSHKADEDWRSANLNTDGSGIAPLFINERIRPDYAVSAGAYNSEAHDYFPIPTSERQINTNLGK
ncbi:RagB/SusD family nutrient uptake outer membrane protein [Sediminitomix flava]|nr:RagB/SusD family nutrient uptake outer membrane protein [Sediminitomix flava]